MIQGETTLHLNSIAVIWHRLSPKPGGKWLFSRLLGHFVPYTGSIPFVVLELEAGRCKVCLRDQKKVRNHLASIHALALANLAEVTSGLALNFKLPTGCQAILTSFQIDYIKKARGELSAFSEFEPPQAVEQKDYKLPVTISNAAGEVVAKAMASWRVGPIKPKKTISS